MIFIMIMSSRPNLPGDREAEIRETGLP
jgi:hypothetical protein